MAFCVKCGANLVEGAAFCAKCGNPIQTISETTEKEVSDGLDLYPEVQPCKEVAKEAPKELATQHSAHPSQSIHEVAKIRKINRKLSTRKALLEFLEHHDPDRVLETNIDSLAKKYRGKESELFNELESQYGVNPVPSIIDGLKRIYRDKIRPLEEAFKFEDFHSKCLTDVDFDARPMVLLLGQYSTGKTTFIEYMLERGFPGSYVGPQPTTDRFVAVMGGNEERQIPGHALVIQQDKPFAALAKFGMAFQEKFSASICSSPILDKITFIDTPGVLSGEKQRIGRSYDFAEVCRWFAERADRIILLFDAHKLDISDEFKTVIEVLKGHDDKVRVVLNKADMITSQQLMRVYGALMWSLGKVIKTPEALRVYLGSFWDKPVNPNCDNVGLFEMEQADLVADLKALPRHSAVRKVNELVKRARMVKVHCFICTHLREQFSWFGKAKKQKLMLDNLLEQFKDIQRKHHLPFGDFPNIERFKRIIADCDISKFPKLNDKMISEMDLALGRDIPRLMKNLPGTDDDKGDQGGANPFDDDETIEWTGWNIPPHQKAGYDNIFHSLQKTQGKISGKVARDVFLESNLSTAILKQIWSLADIDQDGKMDCDEFTVAMHLIDSIKSGTMPEVPSRLPPECVPPSKRQFM